MSSAYEKALKRLEEEKAKHERLKSSAMKALQSSERWAKKSPKTKKKTSRLGKLYRRATGATRKAVKKFKRGLTPVREEAVKKGAMAGGALTKEDWEKHYGKKK